MCSMFVRARFEERRILRNVGSKSQTHERTNALQMFGITDDYLEQIQKDSLSIKDIAPSKDDTYKRMLGTELCEIT